MKDGAEKYRRTRSTAIRGKSIASTRRTKGQRLHFGRVEQLCDTVWRVWRIFLDDADLFAVLDCWLEFGSYEFGGICAGRTSASAN